MRSGGAAAIICSSAAEKSSQAPRRVGYTASVLCFYICALEAALAAGTIGPDKYDAEIGVLDLAVNQMEENIRAHGSMVPAESG